MMMEGGGESIADSYILALQNPKLCWRPSWVSNDGHGLTILFPALFLTIFMRDLGILGCIWIDVYFLESIIYLHSWDVETIKPYQ